MAKDYTPSSSFHSGPKRNNNSMSGMFGSGTGLYGNTPKGTGVTPLVRHRVPELSELIKSKKEYPFSVLINNERKKRNLLHPAINPEGVNDEVETFEETLLKGFKLPQGFSLHVKGTSLDEFDILRMHAVHLGQRSINSGFFSNDYEITDPNGFISELVDLGFIDLMEQNDYAAIINEKNLPLAIIRLQGSVLDIKALSVGCFHGELWSKIEHVLTKYIHPKVKTAVGVVDVITDVTRDGLDIRSTTIEQSEAQVFPCFYPWMNGVSIVDYFQEYLESDAKILYLYGLPGTGKSSMIKAAIGHMGLRALMTANAKITTDPSFITKLCEKTGGDEGKYDIVVVEDADAMLRPRDGVDGNLALNELLSATDGIGSTKFKLVITSNQQDTANVDPALLRHGRAFDIMEFGRLTPSEAGTIRSTMKLPPVKFSNDVTLAQILAGVDQSSMRSAKDDSVSIVGHRFPLNKEKRGVKK